VAGAGTDFHVVRLQKGAALLAPVSLEAEDDFLKSRFRAHKLGQIEGGQQKMEQNCTEAGFAKQAILQGLWRALPILT
jgi:hypothetical protein